ncbi:NPH1 [Symbiodinium natans]|uniref:NPH1 protein n=1 Tax=Symbiodinium natans TaxID=878477 RepID=A0A812PUQ3_9DINO|nr:NPH1 [Symbiodinium natans]
MPAAPLRALGYTSAGGSFAKIGADNKPMSSLMKIGYATGTGNVYCNKIVLMDEAHNLVRSQTQYAEQLQRLRRLLYEGRNLVLAGFTGTPILSEPSEGRQLLDIIKGVLAPDGDEGYLSSFPMRPQPLFPVSLPRGLPDGVLTLARKRQLIRKVEMRGEALKVYDLKRRLGLPGRRLRAYCNVSIFHAAFHDGKMGSKKKILANPDDCCPKLLAIAEAVAASPLKAVIMIARTSGYTVMLELMKHLAAKSEVPFSVATINELSEFNHCSNLRGEVFRVLVADSMQCSEGVSFLSVRRTYLADVPVSPSGFIQQCGRAIRMYGHRGLPADEQTVTTQLFVTMLPKWMRSSSLACWALRAQKKHTSGKEVEKRARVLTARMNRAGIASLEELKRKLDAHGLEKQKSLGRTGREGLTADDVLTFLEQNGLWEEARLLRADKKERELKEKVQEAGETLKRQETESQFLRGATLESVPDPEGAVEEDFANALESMIDEELAAQPREEGEEDERAQEMEALKEEQAAQEEDLDGDEAQKTSTVKADATTAKPTTVAMSLAEVQACLVETLSALRAACRDADRKPSANDVLRRNSSKVFGTQPEADGSAPAEPTAPGGAAAETPAEQTDGTAGTAAEGQQDWAALDTTLSMQQEDPLS